MATRLSIHCGSHTATREQIANAPTPPRTATWVPFPHHRLVDEVRSALDRSGLGIASEAHALGQGGDRYFGLLRLAGRADAADFALTVGIRNSHDRRFTAGLVLGATVMVCDNLSFSGEVRLMRKHTANIERDIPQLVGRAVGQLGDLRRIQSERFAAYRSHELTDGAAHDLVVRALDARVIPVTQVPAVLSEWRAPRHTEFRNGGRTAWRRFNAFTETLKGHLDALPNRTQALHGLIDAACGLAV